MCHAIAGVYYLVVHIGTTFVEKDGFLVCKVIRGKPQKFHGTLIGRTITKYEFLTWSNYSAIVFCKHGSDCSLQLRAEKVCALGFVCGSFFLC